MLGPNLLRMVQCVLLTRLSRRSIGTTIVRHRLLSRRLILLILVSLSRRCLACRLLRRDILMICIVTHRLRLGRRIRLRNMCQLLCWSCAQLS